MFVEQAGQASTIPMFDEASAAVFACLCRLTDGDGHRAQELLIDTFVAASSAPGTPHAVTDLVDSARRLSLAIDRSPAHVERVVADMHLVDRRPLSDIAAVVDQSPDLVAVIVDSLATAPHADLRSSEIWFDDAKRSAAQLAIADRLPDLDGSTSVRRSRRRAVIAAALATAAVLIALTIWIRSGDDAGDATSLPTTVPTTTSVAASTTRAPSTTAVEVATTDVAPTDFTVPDETAATSVFTSDPVGFILDPPLPGYVGYALPTDTFESGDEPPYTVSVWASSDAGPGAGRWLALEIDDADPSAGLYNGDAQLERLEVAGHPALSMTVASGVQRLVVPFADGKQIDALSFGMDATKLDALVAATTIGSDYTPSFGPGASAAFDGLDLISTGRSDQFGPTLMVSLSQSARVQYLNPESGSYVSVSTAPQAPNDLRIAALLAGVGTGSTNETVAIDGRDVLISTLVVDETHTARFAMWHSGSQTIAVRGDLSMGDLLLAVGSSHLATADEWQALLDAVPPAFPYEEEAPQGPTYGEQVGLVTTADGASWTIRLTNDRLGSNANASVQFGLQSPTAPGSSYQPMSQIQVSLSIDTNNPLTRFETTEATILVAAFDGPTAATSMRVTLYRRTPVIVPIVAVPETTLSGAAYVFNELVPYTVELLDANGAVLQTLG